MGRIANLDLLLASDNINEYIIQLDNFICQLCQWGEAIGSLTDGQKIFYYNQNLEREINNGGFSQIEKCEELNQAFVEYKDDLSSLNLDFVKNHQAEF